MIIKHINLPQIIFLISIYIFIIINLLFSNLIHCIDPQTYFATNEVEDNFSQLEDIKQRLLNEEADEMQKLFPEGAFFSYILYGYSWANIGLSTSDLNLKSKAIIEIRWILEKIDEEEIKSQFDGNNQISYGVFYLGWRNKLEGSLIKLQGLDNSEYELTYKFHENSHDLARAFLKSPIYHLDSYPNQSWPCDNIIALSSLKLHDELFGEDMSVESERIIDKWIDYTKNYLLDNNTGLIVHKLDSESGEIIIGPRGSSLVYSLSFLPELDTEFAQDQYSKFKKHFVSNFMSFPLIREYPKGIREQGDVDSGPMIFGYAAVPTVVSIAASKANNDLSVFSRNLLLSEVLGFPDSNNEQKQYLFGKLLVYDAFLVWGKTIVPWTETKNTYNESFDYYNWISVKKRNFLYISLIVESIFLIAILSTQIRKDDKITIRKTRKI